MPNRRIGRIGVCIGIDSDPDADTDLALPLTFSDDLLLESAPR
ncbi:MAG: hypothetical protein ACOX52_04005 [Verrucomicrobiota bacterium]